MSLRLPRPLLATALLAAAVVVVPAMAQDLPATRIVSHATATPNKAGTPKHPRGLSISAAAHLIVPPDLDPPVVTGVDILVGKGLVWNGSKYATCSKRTLDRRGPSGCPRTSLMGSATATGMADTVAARVDVTFFNGGARRRYAYAKLNNPARIRKTLVVEVTKLHSSLWDHRESLRIPPSLQFVAGVPLRLTAIKFTVGGKPYAEDFVASTSCPTGGWKYQVTAHYLYDVLDETANDVNRGAIACTK
jgi:hypothetical protein